MAQEFIDNPGDKSEVDHIDNNKQNNRINNLRLCSRSENNMNTRKQKTCSSNYKGVSYFKRDQKWLAVIHINSGQKHLGLFASEEDAARAYNEKAMELFGEYAKLKRHLRLINNE